MCTSVGSFGARVYIVVGSVCMRMLWTGLMSIWCVHMLADHDRYHLHYHAIVIMIMHMHMRICMHAQMHMCISVPVQCTTAYAAHMGAWNLIDYRVYTLVRV